MTKKQLLSDNSDINYGAVYENAVAQELKAHGFKLYYFNGKKSGEPNFMTEYNGEALPIIVKANITKKHLQNASAFFIHHRGLEPRTP